MDTYYFSIFEKINERYDGKGFPEMASGNAIPISSSIVNLCVDYLDLVKNGKTKEEAYAIISSESNTKYDPKIIGSFQKSKDRFNEVIK